ncbi:MAG: hypothetical protein ACXWEY_09310 [Bacteroidia bacterium]
MKNHLILILVIFSCFKSKAQVLDDRITMEGNYVKLVATWSLEKPEIIERYLSSGDKISIVGKYQIHTVVELIHKNITKDLILVEGEEMPENTIIKVFEHDFDQDGTTEIIICNSPDYSNTFVDIFRSSKGLVEKVGHFEVGLTIALNKGLLSFPKDSNVRERSDYYYKDGAFYELVYHDPNKK